MRILYAPLFFIMMILVGWHLSGHAPISANNKKCRVIQTTQFTGRNSSHPKVIRDFWIYDAEGRLIEDSTDRTAPYVTQYYHYSNDSVIGTTQYYGTMVIRNNAAGLPVFTNSELGIFYTAGYNDSGQLLWLKEFDKYEADSIHLRCLIDSIIYINGNVVFYRVTAHDKPSYTYKCTYYTDKLYSNTFRPVDKLWALCHSPGLGDGFLDEQYLSRNLLKTKSSDPGIYFGYDYDLNSAGDVAKMRFVYYDSYHKDSSYIDYEYKYDCEK